MLTSRVLPVKCKVKKAGVSVAPLCRTTKSINYIINYIVFKIIFKLKSFIQTCFDFFIKTIEDNYEQLHYKVEDLKKISYLDKVQNDFFKTLNTLSDIKF